MFIFLPFPSSIRRKYSFERVNQRFHRQKFIVKNIDEFAYRVK